VHILSDGTFFAQPDTQKCPTQKRSDRLARQAP
jgi:hypothetical protein